MQMGVLGFEPRTSALSELRSSQLSYTPLRRVKQKSQTHRVWPYPTVGWDRASTLLADVNNPLGHKRLTLTAWTNGFFPNGTRFLIIGKRMRVSTQKGASPPKSRSPRPGWIGGYLTR